MMHAKQRSDFQYDSHGEVMRSGDLKARRPIGIGGYAQDFISKNLSTAAAS